MDDRKTCPYCGEKIATSAKKCRYCGEWLEDSKTTNQISETESLQTNMSDKTKVLISTQKKSQTNQFNYPSTELNILVAVGSLGAVFQLVCYMAPEWMIKSVCDYSLDTFVSLAMLSNVLIVGAELVFALMARNKIMKEDWDSKLPLWLLIYGIALGITVLISLVGTFAMDFNDFAEDEDSAFGIIFFFITSIPALIVALKFLGNEMTLKVGLGVLAVLAVDVCTEFFIDLGDLIKPSNGSAARVLLLIIVGAPYYLFMNYRSFLSGKKE